MPRIPRYILPGYPQHVILRGNNRCQIFVVDEDYDYFRHCLTEACGRYSCLVHAYALMTNHAHLLATPSQRTASAGRCSPQGGVMCSTSMPLISARARCGREDTRQR